MRRPRDGRASLLGSERISFLHDDDEVVRDVIAREARDGEGGEDEDRRSRYEGSTASGRGSFPQEVDGLLRDHDDRRAL